MGSDPTVPVSALAFTVGASNGYTPNWNQSGEHGGHQGRCKFNGSSGKVKLSGWKNQEGCLEEAASVRDLEGMEDVSLAKKGRPGGGQHRHRQ